MSARDPAEAAVLARLYDVDLLDDPGDSSLYLALARRTGGPVLELAVGSGRLAVPLAEAGFRVTGVDIDPAMLARARDRAQAAGEAVARRLRLVEADLLDVRLPAAGSFKLVILALNTLLLFQSRALQEAAVSSVARHLAPDGLAVVDVWLPQPEDLTRFDGRVGLEYVRPDLSGSGWVSKSASARHDPTYQTVDLTAVYEIGRQGEPPVRWFRRDRLRLVGADELVALARAAGLEPEILAGSYDLDPLQAGDDRAVLVARPAAAAGPGSAGALV